MKPYIICHMVTSLDGKVTGDFLFRQQCERATEIYYDLNRSIKSNGFICGRVTMESSFTNGWYPDLAKYPEAEHTDFIPQESSGFYAVAFDPKGILGWKTSHIIDDDPGYGGAQIIEVVTGEADGRYLGYLREHNIPYIVAGEREIDVPLALEKLGTFFNAETLLLEGGSIVNGYFERAELIDELSLVVAPVTAQADGKPLFWDGEITDYELKEIKQYGDVVWMNYRRKRQ